MARPKGRFLGNLGIGFELLKRIMKAVLVAGGNDQDLRQILTEGSELPGRIASLLVDEKKSSEGGIGERSEILKGIGVAFEIFKAMADAVVLRDGNDKNLRRLLIPNSILALEIAELIANDKVRIEFHPIEVKGGLTLRQMFDVCRFDKIDLVRNSFGVERVPIEKAFKLEDGDCGKFEVAVINFGRNVSWSHISWVFRKLGLSNLTARQFLVFAAQYRDLVLKQRGFPCKFLALGHEFAWGRSGAVVVCLKKGHGLYELSVTDRIHLLPSGPSVLGVRPIKD